MNYKSSANKIERKRLGDQINAWMVIETTHDARKAFLKELCLGGNASLGLPDILKVLMEQYHIISGIDEEVIKKVLAEVVAEPFRKFNSRVDVVIANEVAPLKVRDGRIEYLYLDSAAEKVGLPYEALLTAFGQSSLAAVLANNIRVRPVVPNEKLAIVSSPQYGQPGRDIFGRITSPITSSAPKSAILKAGAHVREENRHFYSEIYGYVCVFKGEISVLPPIWISPDGFEAHFIHFPQVGSRVLPTQEWLTHLLALMNITQPVVEEQIQKLQDYIVSSGTRKGSILLVQGVAPKSGDDGYLKCHFDSQIKPSMILHDGRLDVEARRKATRVTSGQLLAEIIPPTEGTFGVNLKGVPLSAQDGNPCVIQAGDNVQVEYDGDQPRYFYAKFDGNVRVTSSSIQVYSVLRIGGDVDEKTGNIQTDQDVEIVGSVRAGVKVQAGGSVTIGGKIEQGASVTAKGDIMVSDGITGVGTKVVALGDVAAKSIDDCSVVARRNVMVGDHIKKGFVRAGGKVLVQSTYGSGGKIAGGEVYGAEGVEAREIGDPNGEGHTLVGINLDLEVEARIKKLDETIAFCNGNMLRIFRSLNVQNFDPNVLQEILRRTPPGKKKMITDLLVKLRELIVHKDKAEKQKIVLKNQGARFLEEAEIKISHKAHAGVQIRIGEHTSTLEDTLRHPTFFSTLTGINWQTDVSEII